MYKFLPTILVNTSEALDLCLKESPAVFCIEEPLFSLLHKTVLSDSRFAEYEILVHAPDHYILLLHHTEPNRFDPILHRFIYHPISSSEK